MKNLVTKLIILLLIVIGLAGVAQVPPPQATQTPPQAQAPPAPPEASPASTPQKESELKAKTQTKTLAKCVCLEPAISQVQKAYTSLEEDEWPAAIKAASDSLNAINTLAKTCKCPEVIAYQNTAKAYLNYAKAGNILDGEEEPDCKVAKKLYTEAINFLDDSIKKIMNPEVTASAKNIQEYAKEELQFVKDECEEPTSTPSPAKQPQKPSSSKQ